MKNQYLKYNLIISFFFTLTLVSQNDSNIKKGEIVFSWLKKDSILTELKLENHPKIVPVREQQFIFKVEDSIIKSYEKFFRENGKIDTNDTIYVNRNNNKFYRSSNLLSSDVCLGGHLYEQKIPTFEIIKFKNKRKEIKGYDCYKVIVKTKFSYDKNSVNTLFTYELYVTEKIKMKYHPVLNFDEFVKDFYPLEIIKTGEVVFNQKNMSDYQKYMKKMFDKEIGKETNYKLIKIMLE